MSDRALPGISAEIPDWSREKPQRFYDPGRKLLLSIRTYQRVKQTRGAFSWLVRKICVLRHAFWSIVTGADIPLNCQIGGGLLIPHPNGIVISPHAIIGVNCLVFQQVTIGTRRGQGAPKIDGHVDIGAGAKIFGDMTIPAHSEIRANAVVTKLSDLGPQLP
jgi:serine O-acetyltransferase